MPAEAAAIKFDDYVKLVTARTRRALKRNAVDYRKLVAKVEAMKKKGATKPIKTHTREAVIIPSWVGLTFEVYTGKEFARVDIAANMLGHRLGEFAYSTKRVQHSAPGIRATKGSKFLAVK